MKFFIKDILETLENSKVNMSKLRVLSFLKFYLQMFFILLFTLEIYLEQYYFKLHNIILNLIKLAKEIPPHDNFSGYTSGHTSPTN